MQSALTTSAYTIARATLHDATELLELQRLAYQSEGALYNDFSIPPLKQTLAELEQEFDTKIVLKAQDKDNFLGSIKFYENEDTCYLERLIVHPKFQNQGIGKALITHVETLTETKRLELFTGHKSERNIRFYNKFGYAIFRTEVINDNLTFVFMEKFR